MNLAMWQLWRGELDPARDLLQELMNVSLAQGSWEPEKASSAHACT